MLGAMTTTAERFVADLEALRTPQGIRMGAIFKLAGAYRELPPAEIAKLLRSDVHEIRVGALSIMGKQAAHKKTSQARRKELYELYLAHTSRIDTWDLVDLSAHHVVGAYLLDKPREVLYTLARSEHWWERRIAVYATLALIRRGDLDDIFALAEILAHDPEFYVQKAVGGMVREAGKHDRARLLAYLDAHAATVPRPLLRDAIEHLEPEQRQHYLGLRRAVSR
jgi:3-methyladenine DNA glycosylase AlkD